MAHFYCYQHRPRYRINFQLVLNTAYSCPSLTDCMNWSLKQSQLQDQHQKMQDSDQQKHCTIQPHDTVFRDITRAKLLNGGHSPPSSRFPLITMHAVHHP